MTRFALSLAAVLAATFAPAAQATGCRQVIRHQPAKAVHVPFVKQVAAIAVPVIEVVQQIPYYSSYYQPPVAPPQTNAANVADNGELTAAIKVLVEKLGSIEARLANLERGPGAPPMQPADPPVKPPTKPV